MDGSGEAASRKAFDAIESGSLASRFNSAASWLRTRATSPDSSRASLSASFKRPKALLTLRESVADGRDRVAIGAEADMDREIVDGAMEAAAS
jgi:hypothetical protein